MPKLPARDTRLLLVTIAVSVVMLLVLARLRFPQERAVPAEPVSAPLERLAARATYDELAGILRTLDRSINDSVVAVELAPDGRARGESIERIVPAVRMSDGRAIALVGVGREPLALIPERPVTLVASDAPRGLVVLQMPADGVQSPDWTDQPPALDSPGYAAAVEGTRSGPAIRPIYFGRVDQVSDPRWPGTLLRLSALQQLLPAGAALFTLQGAFIGIGFPDDRDLLVVPAAVLRAEADDLRKSGSIPLADAGIEVQRLDEDLRLASGAEYGVMVSYVIPGSDAERVLRVGDVITAVAGADVRSVADYDAAAMKFRPGVETKLTRTRSGESTEVQITPGEQSPPSESAGTELGMELRSGAGGGAEVLRVAPLSAASAAGVLPGDVITALEDTALPSDMAVRRAYDRLPSGGHLLLGLERRGAHVVVSLTKR